MALLRTLTLTLVLSSHFVQWFQDFGASQLKLPICVRHYDPGRWSQVKIWEL